MVYDLSNKINEFLRAGKFNFTVDSHWYNEDPKDGGCDNFEIIIGSLEAFIQVEDEECYQFWVGDAYQPLFHESTWDAKIDTVCDEIEDHLNHAKEVNKTFNKAFQLINKAMSQVEDLDIELDDLIDKYKLYYNEE